jgi:hypothetical protein
MLDTLGYKRILGIYDSYCFSTAAMVAWTHLNVVLCAYYPFSFFPGQMRKLCTWCKGNWFAAAVLCSRELFEYFQ